MVFIVLFGTISPGKSAENNLPLPRFVSLRSDTVNLRTGPGVRYPVDWIFTRKAMPVEIVAEFETWRKIRDWQGTEGWVHQTMLSGRRGAMITGSVRDLHRSADLESGVVAQAEPGVIGQLLECKGSWCRLEVAGTKGWLPRDQFWGAYPDEDFN